MAMLETTIETGAVRGLPGRNQSMSVFRGIPFARAERWRRPQPVKPWEGTFDAARFGTICPQPTFGFEGGVSLAAQEFYVLDYPMGEDCLVANVWTPARSSDERLPVALYIHGGAYETGYGWLNAYDGEGFNRRGVILVTINYRLNVFGYLALPELAAEDPDGSTGCYGLQDQLAGLDWVRRNIAAFGGDPDRITLFGQSAGGSSVCNVLNSPFSKGKVAGAIMQSGGGLPWGSDLAPRDRDVAYAIGREFLAACGVSDVAGLRALSWAELRERYLVFRAGRGLPFVPAVDGYFLPASPVEYFGRGLHDDIPTIVGATADEMRDPARPVPDDAALRRLAARYPGQENAYLQAMSAGGAPRADEFSDPVGSDMFAGSLAWAANQERLGYTPAHVYYFSYVPPTAGSAHHSVEHHFVFETLNGSPRPYTAADYDLALIMSGHWTNFARHGDPNGPKFPHGDDTPLPRWDAYTAAHPELFVIGDERRMNQVELSRPVAFHTTATAAEAARFGEQPRQT